MAKKMTAIVSALLLALFICVTTGATRVQASEGLLDGIYEGVWFQPDRFDMNIDWFVMDFDGQGNWSMPEVPSYYGSYEIDDQGILIVSQADTGSGSVTYTGSVCPEGVLISLPDPPEGANPGISIALKRPASNSPLQDPAGKRFNSVDFTYRGQQPEILAGFIEFHPSDGTLAMYANRYSEDPGDKDGELVNPGHMEYQYANGRIAVGGVPVGIISPDGDWIIVAKQEEDDPGVILMTRSGNVGEAALEGMYFRTYCSRETNAQHSKAGVEGPLSIDGAGNWQIHDGPGGAYRFLNDRGRLEIVGIDPVTQEEMTITRDGAASPDGNVVLLPDMDGERGVSLLIKAPLSDEDDPDDPGNDDPADPDDDDPNGDAPGESGGSSSGCFVQSLG